ncbi:TetR/AcrR family transcriptional regulator [Modestobacter roseus]|uniref:TetR family transcriptional regulator n=1 Tax=Modestobacter roseus TaxID=1181884 RepID=A0A562IQ49_9ACTN|nr:TetR/AcrR family transcriptional regulator [Modestobacter roseus]MQA34397.1 TetR family transcriptional regulator [Modestobacter roseus]TWH72724.1 TetR family transcriptional regulator [Modestobacter roseus]
MARLTREQSQALTRERILKAAGDVVARDGYDGASVDRIAEAAGYSKGAFYSNFSSKEDALNQLLESHAGRDVTDLSSMLDGLDDVEAILDAVARWSDARAAELKWGLIAIEFLRRARRDGSLTDRERQPFIAQWRDMGDLLLEKLFPGAAPPIDPVDLGGIVLDLTYGGISVFLEANTAGQMVRQILSAFVAAHTEEPAV